MWMMVKDSKLNVFRNILMVGFKFRLIKAARSAQCCKIIYYRPELQTISPPKPISKCFTATAAILNEDEEATASVA